MYVHTPTHRYKELRLAESSLIQRKLELISDTLYEIREING